MVRIMVIGGQFNLCYLAKGLGASSSPLSEPKTS